MQVYHSSSWMYLNVWEIDRVPGTTPNNWLTKTRISYNSYGNTASLLGTWDLGATGFWMITRTTQNTYEILKYNPATQEIDKISDMPSNIEGSYERFGMGVDLEGNMQLSGYTLNSNSNFAFARSTNGGYSWQAIPDTVSNSAGYDGWLPNYATSGDLEIWGGLNDGSSNTTISNPHRLFSEQTATVSSSSLAVFGDTEKITKLGDEANIAYKGTMAVSYTHLTLPTTPYV